nr:hypothetical protein Itr_chr04CG21690 [Ipomoea trifida]
MASQESTSHQRERRGKKGKAPMEGPSFQMPKEEDEDERAPHREIVMSKAMKDRFRYVSQRPYQLHLESLKNLPKWEASHRDWEDKRREILDEQREKMDRLWKEYGKARSNPPKSTTEEVALAPNGVGAIGPPKGDAKAHDGSEAKHWDGGEAEHCDGL